MNVWGADASRGKTRSSLIQSRDVFDGTSKTAREDAGAPHLRVLQPGWCEGALRNYVATSPALDGLEFYNPRVDKVYLRTSVL